MAPQTQRRGWEAGRGGDDRAIAALAREQHGVVSRRQLLAAGVGPSAIKNRLRKGRIHRIHRGVYAIGHDRIDIRGRWHAAVLACGEGAVLSHQSAAALWGLVRPYGPVHVTARYGWASRRHIQLHESHLRPTERTTKDGIPVTSVARTLFDLAEAADCRRLERTWEEADRLGLLELRAVERVCELSYGRRGIKPIRRLLAEARAPSITRSALEERFAEFCRQHRLPPPATNVTLLDREVDAYWSGPRLVVELDGFAYHRHRAAFERDRARDAALQATGYRVIRLTHRRLQAEPEAIAAELRKLLEVPAP